jgi:hypothetical protein
MAVSRRMWIKQQQKHSIKMGYPMGNPFFYFFKFDSGYDSGSGINLNKIKKTNHLPIQVKRK